MHSFSLRAGVASLTWLATVASAQWTADATQWKEIDTPTPPAFDAGRLVPFDSPAPTAMAYGVDPATLAIGSDGVVRYVVVVTSPSGVVNAMHEGIRCATGEFKTYARHNPSGGWNRVQNAEWQSIFAGRPSMHSLWLAKQGVCDGAAPATSVAAIVRSLKNPVAANLR